MRVRTVLSLAAELGMFEAGLRTAIMRKIWARSSVG